MSVLRLILSTLLFFSISIPSFAQPTGKGIVEIREEDGSPSVFPYQIKVSDGTLADGGDGTATVTIPSGGSSEWTDGGSFLRPNETGDEIILGATSPVSAKLSINGDADQVQLQIFGNSTQTSPLIRLLDTSSNLVLSGSVGGIQIAMPLDVGGATTLSGSSAKISNALFQDGTVIDGSADENQLRIQGNATQTSDIFVIENSAGTDIMSGAVGGVRVSSEMEVTGTLNLSGLDCSGNSNGGALTVLAGNQVVCTDDDTGAGSGAFSDAGDPVVLNTTTKDVNIGTTQNNTAKLSIDGDANQVQLSVQGNATQTSDIFVIENSSGTDIMTGAVGGIQIAQPLNVGGAATLTGSSVKMSNALFQDGTVIDGSADENQLRIQANATQASDIFVIEQSDGTDVMTGAVGGVEVTGTLTIISTNTGPSTITHGLTVNNDGASSGAGDDFTVKGNTDDTLLVVDASEDDVEVGGHLESTGTAPAASACGTDPAVAATSTDMSGKVTIGTGTVTSCTITFASAWTNAPPCAVIGDQTVPVYGASTTTTVLTITSATTMDADVLMWVCIGNE